jgi:L-amino acid N-acyltransferase YncA
MDWFIFFSRRQGHGKGYNDPGGLFDAKPVIFDSSYQNYSYFDSCPSNSQTHMTITNLLAGHWPAVKAIYQEGIATGNATFQTVAPEWADWDAAHLPHSRLVALCEPGQSALTAPVQIALSDPGQTASTEPRQSASADPGPVVLSDPGQTASPNHGIVVGWAALSRVSARAVYAGVAEVSVYIAGRQRGRKIGEALLGTLITESERNGIWTLQAGIFPENIASLRIHARCGFRQVGYRERIGQMHGVWRDTVLVERRSRIIGA